MGSQPSLHPKYLDSYMKYGTNLVAGLEAQETDNQCARNSGAIRLGSLEFAFGLRK